MWFFRWKWISYHFAGSLAAIIALSFVVTTFFPDVVRIPANSGALFLIIAASVVVSTLCAIVGGAFAGRHVRGELEEISLGAKNLAYGNLDYRLGFKGNAAFDDIIIAFNEMAERLETQVGALQKLAQENEQLLQETKITAISEERQRLARDLHDAVSQQLFAISMMAATAAKMGKSKPLQALDYINEISQSAARAQSEMRALLLQLRPLTLQQENLPQALKSLALELEGKQMVRCKVDLDQLELPRNIENQLFRIAQEGLSNVLRHAEASKVHISLKISEVNRRVLLIIEDNGKGFVLEDIPQSSIGIRSIKERATLIGATAEWLSVPGKGTKLEIRVPISIESAVKEE